MNKKEAIAKLESLVDQIPALESQVRLGEQFKKWQQDVRVALKHIFPNDRDYLSDFNELPFTLSFSSDSTLDEDYDEAYRSGLRSARAMLQSRTDEIAQFWPDGQTVESVQKMGKPKNPQLVFVIHGRRLLSDFHSFLRALGLKPLEWSKARSLTGKPNPYTWEIVDKALSEAGAIVALLTSDDEARLLEVLWSPHENPLEKEYLCQPRQNVLFEAGVAFGRCPERTVIVRVGSHRPLSDLAGHHILQLDDSASSRQDVADALRLAGCPVDLSGRDWFEAGDFSPPKTRPLGPGKAEKVDIE